MRALITSLGTAAMIGWLTPAQAGRVPATTAAVSPISSFDKMVAKEVVVQFADALEKYFVFDEQGKQYAEVLRAKLASGGYDSFPSAEAFAKTVNHDLQQTHRDGHLQLFAPGGSPYLNHPEPQFIEQAGWIAPHVAYIRFFAFPGDPATMRSLTQFLESHQRARVLIIDARDHHGGGIAEMDLIFSKIFKNPTPLVAMDTRRAADEWKKMPFVRLASVRPAESLPQFVRRIHWAVPSGGPTPLRSAKVFVLTSHQTVSAGEHLAFALKTTHRATLIGEATRGADHFGADLKLPGGYQAFLPVGRTVDPNTGTDWEPGGVSPDINVPANEALTVALERSGLGHEQAARINSEQPKLDKWGRRIERSARNDTLPTSDSQAGQAR